MAGDSIDLGDTTLGDGQLGIDHLMHGEAHSTDGTHHIMDGETTGHTVLLTTMDGDMETIILIMNSERISLSPPLLRSTRA